MEKYEIGSWFSLDFLIFLAHLRPDETVPVVTIIIAPPRPPLHLTNHQDGNVCIVVVMFKEMSLKPTMKILFQILLVWNFDLPSFSVFTNQ